MKTIKDIKLILIPENQNNEIINKFSSLNCEKIYYKDEIHLGEIISTIQDKFNSKEVIILKNFQGRFFQKCPGSPNMICCNYLLINTGFNCLYDCTYCYLQSYLNSFGIIVFINNFEVLNELQNFLDTMDPSKVYRIGTGEFTDSLMIDKITDFGPKLIKKLSEYKNIFLELKTKSDLVDHLLEIPAKGNAVIGWSMNTPHNIKKYEQDSSTLDARLKAARKACDSGYFLAFHFDPIILYENWQNDYKDVIKRIFDNVEHSKIVWISLGGFRFTPSFLNIMRKNFPDEKISNDEFYPAVDMKYRYFKPMRKQIYNFFVDEIRKYSNIPYIYMCMEADYMWNDVFDLDFKNNEEFEDHFTEYLKNNFIKNE